MMTVPDLHVLSLASLARQASRFTKTPDQMYIRLCSLSLRSLLYIL